MRCIKERDSSRMLSDPKNNGEFSAGKIGSTGNGHCYQMYY